MCLVTSSGVGELQYQWIRLESIVKRLEILRRMAPSTGTTERTLMHIVRQVAVAANLGNLFALRLVAGIATNSCVRTGQRELGLRVVIERPLRPGRCVVTCGTVDAQASLVDVVFRVAVAAGRRGIFEPGCLVAVGAGCGCMFPKERKWSQSMVEPNGVLPAHLVVAGLAARSKLARMFVVLSVAGKAVRCDLLFSRRLHMAGRARCRHMLAAQRERRPIVVERRFLPAERGVALGAFRTVSTLMRVVLAMTVDTFTWKANASGWLHVARLARRVHVLSDQWESRVIVIKESRLPVDGVMALRAVSP